MNQSPTRADDIAIIGMVGRFPQAKNLDEYWQLLRSGGEGISFFTDEDMARAGVAAPPQGGKYVKARGVLERVEWFDAAFFDLTPKEAELMDPQQRVFLECASEALECAGYDPERYAGAIGVFGGQSLSTYLLHNLAARPDLMAQAGDYQIALGNDKDFLATRVAYKLNLRGPSLSIQTACSTSLVAVCAACESLLSFQCDLALAGAVAISFPQIAGYLYQAGAITSPDGHCRPFDAQAAGTVPGQGVGIVVLKRLAEAKADGDEIAAVIKGFAVNNDGSRKVGFAAPSVAGQAEVIALAQAMAGVDPETVGYIEAHGTGTPLGDPVELTGLLQAFRACTTKNGFCAVGSVKSNIGHLDTAAGVAGLIKTVLALQHRQLPPSLHFHQPNPQFDFNQSPFYVNTVLRDWRTENTPRRAGVSSLGIGGTNAHVVLEEAPPQPTSGPSRPWQLLVLSAKTGTALERSTANLAEYLRKTADTPLADIAYTLQVGRPERRHRRILVCRDAAQAMAGLEDRSRMMTQVKEAGSPSVIYMFPGQGAQFPRMGLGLYEQEPAFREQVEKCCLLLEPHLEFDLRETLFGYRDSALTQTSIAQPALFVIEYALAQLWMKWGIQPEAMIGHSIGEYVAACLAGVFTLEEALSLVAARARLMQQMPAGAMLALRLGEAEVRPLLGSHLSLAAVNGPALCVVSGPNEAVEALRLQLAERNVASRKLNTSHAFHSAMMEPVLASFADLAGRVKFQPPRIPYLSNVSGTWVLAAQATDPNYWAQHIRQTVRFADGLATLLQSPGRVCLEVGPGQTLQNLARQHPASAGQPPPVASLPRPEASEFEVAGLLQALGELWLAAGEVNWDEFYRHERRRRVALPTYPFERRRYWVDPPALAQGLILSGSATGPTVASERIAEASGALARPTVTPEAPGAETLPARVRAILGELSGLDLRSSEGSQSFVQMGFDSLLLTQVSLRLEQTFGIQMPFRKLLEECNTLDRLTSHLQEVTAKTSPQEQPEGVRAATTSSPPIPPASDPPHSAKTADPRVQILPLTAGQRELWFAAQVSTQASCAFNESCLLRLQGRLSLAAAQQALQALVERHEALRATFTASGEAQQIHPELPVEMPLVDLTSCSEAVRDERSQQIYAEAVAQPFDLTHGPMLRASLVRLGPESHVVVLAGHHLICDGRSFGILLHEFAALYGAQLQGAPVELPAAPQFSEFVRRQTVVQPAPEAARDEQYWRTRFQGELPVLELPLDRPRPATQTFAGARVTRSLDPALVRSLRDWSASQGCTLFTTLLSAYYAWLHRLSGQNDLIVGVPVAERAAAGEANLVGHCVSFLPLRVEASATIRFCDLTAAVKKGFYEALDHRRFASGDLLRQLNVPRSAHRPPLASATFTLDRISDRLCLAGLEGQVESNPNNFSYFDVSLGIAESEDGLELGCRYNASIFTAATWERAIGYFENLLRGIVANPESTLAKLPMLSPAELHTLLVEWNDTRRDFPRNRCLHQLFDEQAQVRPEATAVTADNRAWTYRELKENADAVAARLVQAGVGAEDLVGIYFDRSPEMVASLLGILKAGGAYLPLGLEYPRERLRFMLEDSGASFILTQRHLARELPPTTARIILYEESTAGGVPLRQTAAPLPAVEPNSDPLAYVIYTSGSTGKPKGVMITHRSLVNALWSFRSQLGITPKDSMLATTTLCFDIAGLEVFLPLIAGARVVLASREATQNVARLPDLIRQSQATFMQATPVTWRLLGEAGWLGQPGLKMLCGGEALGREQADDLRGCGAALWNLYGPTETTIWSTAQAVEPGVGPIPIGRPIANTQAYVLDAQRQPVPVGVTGELYLGGDGLARGYLNRPEQTEIRFVPHPFSQDPAARLYRTGDLVRYRPDGALEFVGRADSQVKLHGYRIELGEIEAALVHHSAVRQAVVCAHPEAGAEKKLVAYVVAAAAGPSTAADLRQHLRQTLPEYMIPSAFVWLDKLPLTSNGKVDRRSLPPPEPSPPEVSEGLFLPPTATEKTLTGVWRELLGVKQVGVNDNFFVLGGHSVLAIRVISRIRRVFGVELQVRAMFEAPTIAGLARAIEAAQSRAPVERAPVKKPIRSDSVAALLSRREQMSDVEVAALLTGMEFKPEVEA